MKVKLKECIEIKNGKEYSSLNKGSIPVYGTGGIFKFVDDYLYDKEAILLPRKGSLDNVMYTNNQKFWTVDTMYYALPKESVNGRYLFYYLSLLKFSKLDVGSTIPSMTTKLYYDIEVDLPSLEEQDKIASILSGIDCQIEKHNTLLNKIKAVTEATYCRWFNQFEFPNENGRPYKSSGGKMYYNEELKREIPVGWSAASLNSLVTLNRGISYSSEDLLGDGIPMVNLASFNTDSTFKYEGLKTFSGQASENKYVNNYDLLMCVTQQTAIDLIGDTDVIAKTFILPPIFDGSVVSSMDVVNIVCNHKPLKYYIDQLFKMKDIHKYATGFANGTKIKHLDIVGVLELKVPVPDDMTVIDKFAEISENMVTMGGRILKENLELKKLKDYLLPMLMNGQLQIK